MHIIGDVNMKRENNKKFKKRKRNQNRSLTCRVLSMMFAIVLFCSTVLINTDYVSQASSFDDMVDMVEVEEDSAAVDISEETGDDLGTDVNFESEESTDETYSESDDLGSSDADFSSGENMFTDGTSESSVPAEEAAQPVSCIVNLKNETIEIKAEAPAGVLPNGTQMIVKAVENNTEDAELTDQYNKLAAKITEQLQSQGKNLDGFLAYNVSFTDADGNPVEPSDKVTYSFTYKEASSPELTDPAASTVTAARVRTNKETSELELTELKAEEDQLTVETNESRQLTKAAFQSAGTDTYTFVWSSTPAADDNENNENKEENGEVNNEEVNADTNTENTEENGEETNTENNVENSEEEQNPEEAPDQEQIKMIRITADEVNLRVAPSTEAEVIATVATDTQLPLLETVTDEDEFTWYKVSYEEAEAYVRSDMAEVVENEEQDVKVEEQTPAEITRYDYESDEVNVKVTLTNPEDLPDEAELSVTPVEISQEAEEQINQDAIEQQKAIENIRAYDIKFLLDGEEIQPGETVKVEVSFPEEETAEDADVYHVDENENVENMDGSVNEEGNVEFDTTHFSTYVIVNKGRSTVEVTLQHYCGTTKIYADTVRKINVGGEIPDYRATENYKVEKVVTVKDGTETPVSSTDEIQVVSDTTVKIYYTPMESTKYGDVVFYDYQVEPEKGKGINDATHYHRSYDKNWMIMGTKEQAGVDYDALGKDNKNANTYREGKDGITKELISGLSRDFTTVNWNVDQPGFFTDENLGEGKDKYTDYDLQLEKKGNTYKLNGVRQPNGNIFTYNDDGSNFFPLIQSELKNDNVEGAKYYFGMRYDINFKLGDYVGPLNYSFTGDDDLWVLLDGKVVIDLGGIHQALSETTDLWDALGFKEGVGATKDDDKKKTHRLTILYMERGAWASNCKMEFTIPDPKFVDVNNVPLAEITINKTNSNNKPLPGAMFRLTNDNDSSDTYPIATTDGNGEIKFDNLKAGVYTLTEAVAPNGYVALKETYKIKVTVNDDKATAKLYKSDGTTEVEGNNIINYTETEEAEKNLTSSKSAKVVDDKNRIYQINLNAEVTGKEADQEAKNASVVLVLDASDSMNDPISKSDKTKKIVALRNAANKFIETLSKKSADSQVSIIWYRGNEGGSNLTDTLPFQKLNPSGVKNLKSNIDNEKRTIDGGTPMGSALEAAYNQLKSAANGNDKYVLFMTDGMPGYFSDNQNFNCMTANKAVNYANKIKDSNNGKAVLYTVGVGVSGSFKWKEGHSESSSDRWNHGGDWWNYNSGHESCTGLNFLASNIASGSDHAYDTNNVTDLVKEFELIAGKIGDLYTVQPTSIVDVIDARFELTEDSVNNLAQKVIAGNKGIVEKVNESNTEITWKDDENKEVGKITIVKNSDGTTTITWTGAAAKIGNKAATEEADKGWKASFKVKAKDDFIGGNMIPTNGAASGIYLNGGGVKKFEQPSVNVKLLDLNIENKEITVFKGDPISAQNFRSELAETLNIKQLDGKTKLLTIGENQEFEYTYPGSNDAVGKFICTYEAKGNINEHTATEVGTAVEQYKLTVTYHPYSLDERKPKLSKTLVKEPTLEGGTVVGSDLTKEGTYTVNVIAGQIQITKKLVKNENNDPFKVTEDNGQTFTFKVTKLQDESGTIKNDGAGKPLLDTTFGDTSSDGTSKTGSVVVTVTVPKDSSEGSLTSDQLNVLQNLPRGIYEVEEVETSSDYEFDGAEVDTDKTDCYAAKDTQVTQNKKVRFSLGYKLDKNNVINVIDASYKHIGGGQNGIVIYTNKLKTANLDLKKTDEKQDNPTYLSGAYFKLEKKSGENWISVEDSYDRFVVSNGNGAIELNNLRNGEYRLTEVTAPSGYMLLSSPICFTVSNGTVTLINAEGTVSNMCKLTPSTDSTQPPVLTIKNQKLYSLPESGGNGIYWYMIGGMVLMSTAAWILYKNKCREVLGK